MARNVAQKVTQKLVQNVTQGATQCDDAIDDGPWPPYRPAAWPCGLWSVRGMSVGMYLKASPLLRGFTDDGVKIIQAATTTRTVQAGTPIFVEQMHGESLFIIASGRVELYVSRGGNDRPLAVLDAPDHFGEISLLHPGPRRMSVRAVTTTELLEIGRRDFLSLQKQRPQACMKLMLNIIDQFSARAAAAAPLMQRVLELGL